MLICAHVQSHLLFVHEFLVQPAGFSAPQNCRGKVGLGVARFENRRGQPRLIHAWQLHVVLNHGAALGRDRRRFCRNFWHVFAPFEGTKIFFNQLFGVLRLEIPDDGQACVIGGVVQLKEVPYIFELCGLDVLVRTDNVAVIRMTLGIKQVHQPFFDGPVRLVLHALTALIADNVLLVGKIGLIQLVRQVAHAVGFEPKRKLQLVRRQRLEIIRAVKIRGAVDVRSARRFQIVEVRTARHVP